YSWGAANPAGGAAPGLQDVTLAVASDTVDPALWGHLAAGIHLPSATIHVRTSTPSGLTEYLTYTLSGVSISSFTTAEDGSGALPQDTIQLHFGEVKEQYFRRNPNGTLGSPNTADYNQVTGTSGGA